ncbi:MAG: outer membrane protein assembly factor BamE [Burkholderiaceae bacterium]
MSASLSVCIRIGASITLAAGLAACSGFDGASQRLSSIVTPYRIDIVQGNFVSSEQVQQLRIGMGRQAVRDMLGTPLLQSIFHADRWDYVFAFHRKGDEPQLRKVAVFFKNDALERFEADTLPTEAEFVSSLAGRVQSGKTPVLEASEDTLKSFPAPTKAAEPKPLPPLPASYPPLESATP